jgi:HD-like signal output (HDOD) protein
VLQIFRRKRNRTKELKSLFSHYELPTFPAPLMEALRLLRDPNTPLDRIGRAISANPGLHVKILTTVNSAAFGLRAEVRTLEHAVSLLGRARVEAVLLSVATHQTLPKAPLINEMDFWATSARRAAVARHLAQRIHPATAEESFTAGLLQDLAVPVLAAARAERYGAVIDAMHTDKRSLPEVERELLDLCHTEVGAYVAERWELPPYLIEAIANHHGESASGEAVTLVAPITGNDPEEDAAYLLGVYQGRLGINTEEADGLLAAALTDAESLAAAFMS